ncbi:hypothetical protein BDR05DRAFT_953587 [Suillus weaverae]|nr:hypothetical protein BDR05DRAFT_953587 [Suillus weaverae]
MKMAGTAGDQSHPALTDDLPLFNDPDLYLGPEDDVIEFDDAPAVPDSPMTGGSIPPISCAFFMEFSTVPEAPVTSNSTAIEHQSPKPEMAYEDLHAMVREFMPIRSFDHTEHRLGDYEQCHGNLPDPTVAQLLESHRPFCNTWAETCDKLRKADADLRRMQRVRQSTIEMLEVLETLIDYFEDEDPDTLLYTLPTQYLVHGARWPVLHAQDGTRDSGLRTQDSGFGTGTVLQNPEPRTLELGTRDSIFSTVSNSELPTPNPEIRSLGL